MPAQCRMPTAWPTSYAPQSCCSLDCRLVAGALSPANCSLDVNGRSDVARVSRALTDDVYCRAIGLSLKPSEVEHGNVDR